MSQEQFFNLLSHFPRLQHCWNQEKRELNIDLFEQELAVLSSGEAHQARFLAGVWLGRNKYEFDLIDAAPALNQEHIELIADWMKNPFWP